MYNPAEVKSVRRFFYDIVWFLTIKKTKALLSSYLSSALAFSKIIHANIFASQVPLFKIFYVQKYFATTTLNLLKLNPKPQSVHHICDDYFAHRAREWGEGWMQKKQMKDWCKFNLYVAFSVLFLSFSQTTSPRSSVIGYLAQQRCMAFTTKKTKV